MVPWLSRAASTLFEICSKKLWILIKIRFPKITAASRATVGIVMFHTLPNAFVHDRFIVGSFVIDVSLFLFFGVLWNFRLLFDYENL